MSGGAVALDRQRPDDVVGRDFGRSGWTLAPRRRPRAGRHTGGGGRGRALRARPRRLPRESRCRAPSPTSRSVAASGTTPCSADLAGEDLAGAAVDGDRLAGAERPAADRHGVLADLRAPPRPTTAGMPQPRATTAAWLARPPRDVRMPAARAMPWTSSGDVSARTRITGRPGLGGRDRRVRRDVAISPQATPGEAGSPRRQGPAPRGRGLS